MRQVHSFGVKMIRWYLLQSFSFEGIFGVSRHHFLDTYRVRHRQNEEY